MRKVIPTGIDLSVFEPGSGEKTAHPSVLFVGTLDGRKRGGLLLKWFREVVRPQVPDATLTIVGPAGPAVEGVTYRMGISVDDLAEMYRRAWLFASPSSYEGFGLPYVEAMASGTPVVASPNPGSHEVLDSGQYGRLVSDQDFPSAIVEILTDEGARAELTRRGLERAQVYGLDAMVDGYESLIRELSVRGSGRNRGRSGWPA